MHTTLTTRRLGGTDMEITTVGFGAWAIGGGDWVRHAAERGINWIDTAAVYGLGHSEEVVRRALEEIPAAERPYVFTKCGLVWNERDRMASPEQVLRPESISRCATRSGRSPSATVAEIAIAWTLEWTGVTAAIVGARTPEQVDGWIDAGSIELTREDLEEISSIVEKTGAGSGPALPR
jgi:aryl-alcohol dehydrogenase-like predicted oxidoreductase